MDNFVKAASKTAQYLCYNVREDWISRYIKQHVVTALSIGYFGDRAEVEECAKLLRNAANLFSMGIGCMNSSLLNMTYYFNYAALPLLLAKYGLDGETPVSVEVIYSEEAADSKGMRSAKIIVTTAEPLYGGLFSPTPTNETMSTPLYLQIALNPKHWERFVVGGAPQGALLSVEITSAKLEVIQPGIAPRPSIVYYEYRHYQSPVGDIKLHFNGLPEIVAIHTKDGGGRLLKCKYMGSLATTKGLLLFCFPTASVIVTEKHIPDEVKAKLSANEQYIFRLTCECEDTKCTVQVTTAEAYKYKQENGSVICVSLSPKWMP